MPAFAHSAETVIINPSVLQNVSEKQLRSIFSMRRRNWENGTPIRVFVLPDSHPTHKAFCKNTLGMFPHRLRKTWDRLVFTGTGQAPEEIATEEAMLEKIRQTPGAVGYISTDKIDGSVRTIPQDKDKNNADEQ